VWMRMKKRKKKSEREPHSPQTAKRPCVKSGIERMPDGNHSDISG
jgi:hypothetical protein